MKKNIEIIIVDDSPKKSDHAILLFQPCLKFENGNRNNKLSVSRKILEADSLSSQQIMRYSQYLQFSFNSTDKNQVEMVKVITFWG